MDEKAKDNRVPLLLVDTMQPFILYCLFIAHPCLIMLFLKKVETVLFS
jgi:hypothetical protein